MKQRDLVVVALSVAAIALAFYSQEGRVALTPLWRQHVDTTSFRNSHFPMEDERLPPPLVTDLDGDHYNEIVYVTPALELRVLNTSAITGRGLRTFGLPELPAKATAPLVARATLGAMRSGRRPVALAAGYIAPADADGGRREQIVVVLSEDWTLSAFSARLNLLWEAHLRDFASGGTDGLETREVALLVTHHAIRNTDAGAVVVGGRLVDRSAARVRTLAHDHQRTRDWMRRQRFQDGPPASLKEATERAAAEAANAAAGLEGSAAAAASSTGGAGDDIGHFSYYALDGATGAVRWKHEAGDFHDAPVHTSDDSAGGGSGGSDGGLGHPVKLHFLRNQMHLGEVDWRDFKDSMIAHLPYRWQGREDTRLKLAHFSRESTRRLGGPRADEWTWSEDAMGLDAHHVVGGGSGGGGGGAAAAVQHSESEHVLRPNVLFAHTSQGVQAVHLFSGRMLCQLPLVPEGVYADINDDGVIENVQAVSRDGAAVAAASAAALSARARLEGQRAAPCYGLATTGVPVQAELFNASICDSKGFLARAFQYHDLMEWSASDDDDDLEALQPVLIRAPTHRPLLGWRIRTDAATKGALYDAVFLLNTGRMTSYAHNGRFNWQLDTDTDWRGDHDPSWFQRLSASVRAGRGRRGRWLMDPDEEELARDEAPGRHPSLTPFSVSVHGEKSAVLAIGSAIALVSNAGDLLASAAIVSGAAVQPPVIGDFNNDGINDIIVVTGAAIYGYALNQSPGSLVLPVALALLVLVFAVFIYRQHGRMEAKRLKRAAAARAQRGAAASGSSGGGSSVLSPPALAPRAAISRPYKEATD